MNKFEALLKKNIAKIYTTKDPLAFIQKPKLLPDTYQEVEYIKPVGNAYIDPNVTITTNIGFKFTMNIPSNSAHGTIIGQYLPGNYNFFLYSYDDGRTSLFSTYQGPTYSVNFPRDIVATYSFINGVSYSSYDGSTFTVPEYATHEVGQPLYIFAGRQNNFYSSYKLYKDSQIYIGSTAIRNFIPCYRKADGVTGLYDTVSDTFFTNAGTGSLIRGPEIIYSSEFNDLKIYGDSIQNEVPSPTSPVDVKSIGTLVASGQHSGQYEIKILINNGSTLTPYYFYISEPLRRIGTTADVLDYKNHKVIRNIKEYILEGTEAVGLGSTSQSDKKRLYILTPGTARSGNNAVTVLCSHYPSDTANRNYSCVLSCCGYDSIGRSCIYDDNYQTTTAFNTFASGLYNNNTPIKLYGILDTPVEEIIIKEPGIN